MDDNVFCEKTIDIEIVKAIVRTTCATYQSFPPQIHKYEQNMKGQDVRQLAILKGSKGLVVDGAKITKLPGYYIILVMNQTTDNCVYNT